MSIAADRPGPAVPTALDPLRLRELPRPHPRAWHPSTAGPEGGDERHLAVVRGDVPLPVGRGGPALELPGLPVVAAAPDEEDAEVAAHLPCPEQLARRLVQAVVDVVRGHRPATQVLRWTTPEVYSQLRQRARLEQQAGRTGGRRPVVRSLRTSACGDRGVEVSAVVLDGRRARAVAARLDGEDARWRLTALVIG